jgi:hypothetical protein
MRHMIIPDTQVKPGESVDHLRWAGLYAVDMLPDVIVMIGDWYDMGSLSSYDKGKKCFEGRRYVKDIDAGNHAMDVFMAPIREFQAGQRSAKKRVWNPRLIFTRGNHCERIERAINDDAMLESLMSFEKDTNLLAWGWEVHPFLEVVVVDGVAYSHYFTSGVMGRPVTSARALLTKKHMSCVMGHVQQRDIAFADRADGTRMTGIHVGVYSPHEETYLNPQTNQHWRGLWVLHEVQDGSFDEMPVSLSYLKQKYGKRK